MAKQTKNAKIRKFILANPDAKAKDVAVKFGTSVAYVYLIRHKLWKQVTPVARTAATPEVVPPTPSVTMIEPKADPVNHPAHYKVGGVETIDFIEAKKLGYNLGNVIKYITRAAHKGNASEDLAKARWYLNREIANLSGAR